MNLFSRLCQYLWSVDSPPKASAAPEVSVQPELCRLFVILTLGADHEAFRAVVLGINPALTPKPMHQKSEDVRMLGLWTLIVPADDADAVIVALNDSAVVQFAGRPRLTDTNNQPAHGDQR